MLTIILSLLLQLAASDVSRSPARLVSVVEPAPPWNSIGGGSVLSEVTVDPQGKVVQVAVLQGKTPFIDSTTQAARQWTFQPAKVNNRTVESKVAVLAVFRPPSFDNFAVGGPSLGFTEPMPGTGDHPPLPMGISDPGYPQASTAMGVVVLELNIDRNGIPSEIRTIRDVPSLTEIARDAVHSWRFVPAMASGQPIEGSLIVLISFLRPVIALP